MAFQSLSTISRDRKTGSLPIFAILLPGIKYTIHLLPGIWDTLFNILVSFRDIEYFGKLIMGIFASL